MDKLAKFIGELMACYSCARIYTFTHPRFVAALDSLHAMMMDIFTEDDSVSFGFVGMEITSGDRVFFELTKKAKAFITAMNNKKIDKITLTRGVTKEEIKKFIEYIMDVEGASLDRRQLSAIGITNIFFGEFSAGTASNAVSMVDDLFSKSEKVISSFSDLTGKLIGGETINAAVIPSFLGNLQDNFSKYIDLFRVSIVKRYDVNTFYHSINVAVLAMSFARHLGYGNKDVNDIGVAALFHDIGKIYISENVINKDDKLTDKEFAQVKSHTVLGAQILLNYTDTLGILPVIVAFQHHKGFDGMRYPKTQFLREVNEIALIVSLCDVYDALSQRRSYKVNYSSERVYSIIEQQKGKLIKPELFEKFFDFIGVWPNGTIVKLSSGAIGVVESQNRLDRFSPYINLFADIHLTSEIIDLHCNEELRISRSLHPSGEGKRYFDVLMKS